MRLTLPVFYALLVLLLLVPLAHSSRILLRVSFEKPLPNGTWLVSVLYESPGYTRHCFGALSPNPYYVETKGVSKQLIVAPLYYIVDSVCRGAGWLVEELSEGNSSVEVELVVPHGYVVRTALDWRGFGPLGGPYVVPAGLLVRFYLYDGVVVALRRIFHVVDSGGLHLSLIYGGGVGGGDALLAARVVACVASRVAGWLGPSPRSPSVVVVVGSRVHPLYPPGFAFSLGSVIYIKVGGAGLDWLVHTAAHEALHSWFNDGLLYGGFAVAEAVPEFLALRALRFCNESLYSMAEEYARSIGRAGGDYVTWAAFHERLWRLTERICGADVYDKALRVLFDRAIREGGLYLNLFEFIEELVKQAPLSCRARLAAALGPLYPGSGAAATACKAATVTVTSTTTMLTTITLTETRVETTTATVTCAARGGSPEWGVAAVALAVAAAILALRPWRAMGRPSR